MSLIQKLEVTVLAFILWALTGCASLQPAQQAKLDRFECQVAALASLVEPSLDAAELVRDLYKGQADLGRVLGSLNAGPAEVAALLERLRACEPQPELPEGGSL